MLSLSFADKRARRLFLEGEEIGRVDVESMRTLLSSQKTLDERGCYVAVTMRQSGGPLGARATSALTLYICVAERLAQSLL